MEKDMNKTLVAMGTSATMLVAALAYAQSEDHSPFSSLEEKESYGMGTMIGQQLKEDVEGVDRSSFLEGLNAGFAGESKLSEQELAKVLEARHVREREAAVQQAQETADNNERVGSAFRDDFAKQEDVVTLESGLQYKVIAPGTGEPAGPGGTVTVHYRGTFVDGTEFDTSYDGEPLKIDVERVIPGWSEALKNMPAGAKWQVVIPPSLAYGDRGAGPIIEPGSTLVFEIELIEVG
jgi:FKBP-type peptidyl-prolyl cis-trans isomerase FklB